MKKVSKFFKNRPSNVLIALIVAFLVSVSLVQLVKLQAVKQINYSEFKRDIESKKIKRVVVDENKIYGEYKDGQGRFEAVVGFPYYFMDSLNAAGVDIAFSQPKTNISVWNILFLIMVIISLVYFYFFLRDIKGSGSGNGALGIGKSKARMFLPSQIKVNFNSVAGAIEAKEELTDVIDYLKNPDKYSQLGAKLTRGILLVGEPGNGKTMLAKAVAGEANCPFFSISGSDFIEVFVGVGAARIRDLFAQARKHAPCIIFIDEIDAVGRQRGSGLGGGHDEREQTLNQLLVEMDGFESSSSTVVVLAATNRPDVLDKALLRPGRFDRTVRVPFPDLISREKILEVHSKNVKLGPDVDLKKIARGTRGFTGADLANLINEAAINASRNNKLSVQADDFEEARDKVMIGKENKSIVLSEKERKVTAYHESGHALVPLLLPENADPLHKLTIVPRGNALGVTFSLPEGEKHSRSKEEMELVVMKCLGGRAAEELVFNKLEVGAYSDFVSATQIVRAMVCSYGMSPVLGPVVYGQDYSDYKYSEDTAQKIDNEVRRMMSEYYERVKKLLADNREMLDKLANKLFEKETLQASEVYELLGLPPRELHSFK